MPEVFAGSVHSVFARAVNLVADDGSPVLLTLADPDLPAGPAGIAAEWAPGLAALRHGERARIGAGVLRAADTEVRLDGAALYDSTFPEASAPPAAIAAALEAAQRASVREAGAKRREGLSSLGRRRAHGLAAALADALVRGAVTEARDLASALVGLGPGLTPSGDDVLTGVLAARAALGADSRRGDRAVREVALGATGRTTDIAASYLALAASGRFAEPLRGLAASIVAGDAAASFASATRCLRVGATSGADGAFGVVATFSAACRTPIAKGA